MHAYLVMLWREGAPPLAFVEPDVNAAEATFKRYSLLWEAAHQVSTWDPSTQIVEKITMVSISDAGQARLCGSREFTKRAAE